MMDTTNLIGANAFSAGLQKQAQVKAAAVQAAGSAGTKKAREAAQQFEGFFVSQMFEQMMSGIEADPTFGGGYAEETWRSMLNQEYGKQVAKSGRLGIADSVMKAMLQAQEQRSQPASASADGIDTAAAAQGAPAAFMPLKRSP